MLKMFNVVKCILLVNQVKVIDLKTLDSTRDLFSSYAWCSSLVAMLGSRYIRVLNVFRLIWPRSYLHEDVDMYSIKDLVKLFIL
jgi:hypothetical protein